MAGSRAGRARESGPPGPEVRASETVADRDLFVDVPNQDGHILFREGDYIPPALAGLPRVDAVWANGVLVPGS
jgi:hypothetical protein